MCQGSVAVTLAVTDRQRSVTDPRVWKAGGAGGGESVLWMGPQEEVTLRALGATALVWLYLLLTSELYDMIVVGDTV
jgi:hypothetical protein